MKRFIPHLQWITPVGLFVIGFYISTVKTDIRRVEKSIEKLDGKVFLHLTNDELHTPKSIAVTKAEFQIYQNLRDIQMTDLKNGIMNIQCLLEKKK